MNAATGASPGPWSRRSTLNGMTIVSARAAHRMRIIGDDLVQHPLPAPASGAGAKSSDLVDGHHCSSHAQKISPFEKQSANQILLSVSDRERGEIYPDAGNQSCGLMYEYDPYRRKKARTRRASSFWLTCDGINRIFLVCTKRL